MPGRKPKAYTKPDNSEQSARFKETARALGSDEDEAAFKAKLAEIARQKPAPDTEAPKPAPKKPVKD